jgi:hypothetical protein
MQDFPPEHICKCGCGRMEWDNPPADFDEIDPSLQAGTAEYWKARARQGERRYQRVEREKTELVTEIAQLKLAAVGAKSPREDRRRAILADGALGGTSGTPASFGRP